LRGHNLGINSVIELSNGNLASGSVDKTIRIWNPDSGNCLSTLKGHNDEVYSVIELRNGNLASCSYDRTIKIWNPNTRKCLYTLDGHNRVVNSVIELRNGNLASFSDDGTIKIWNMYPDDLSAQQIYLAIRLSKYARRNDTIKLDSFWFDIYNSLPGYLKDKYQNAVE
jgi:WD40 repeat protein